MNFSNYYVKTPCTSIDSDYIKSKIRERVQACSATLCLIGTTTARSLWVDWEVPKRADLGKTLLVARLHSSPTKDPTPKALGDTGVKILNWDIDVLVKELQ